MTDQTTASVQGGAADASAASAVTTQVAAETVQTGATEKTEAQTAWASFDAADASAAKPNGDGRQAAATTDDGKGAAADAAANTDPKTAQQTQGPDIWASAPTELKAVYDKLKGELETAKGDFSKLDQAAKSDRGRIAAFQRQIKDLTKASAGASGNGATADAAKSVFETPAWLEFKAEYPDVAKAQEAALAPLLTQFEGVRKKADSLTQERTNEALAAEEAIVTKDHPDFATIAKSEAFEAWYHGLDREDPEQDGVARAVEANKDVVVNGKQVSKVIAKFKAATGKGAGAGQTGQQTTAATDAGGGGSSTPARTALDDKRDVQLESSSSPRTQGVGAVSNGVPGDAKGAWDHFERIGL